MDYARTGSGVPAPVPAEGGVRPAPRRLASTMPLLVLAVFLALPGAALAQEDPAEESLIQRSPEEISKMSLGLQVKFMSPYCPGANLRDCTSGQAQVLRDEIRAWVTEGHSESWITDRMVERFGEEILAAPPFRGFGILAWVMPVVALLLGLAFVVAYLKRQNRMALAESAGAAGVPRNYVPSREVERQVEDELNARVS